MFDPATQKVILSRDIGWINKFYGEKNLKQR